MDEVRFTEEERLSYVLRYIAELPVEEVALIFVAEAHMPPITPGVQIDPEVERQNWLAAVENARRDPEAIQMKIQNVKTWALRASWKLKLYYGQGELKASEFQVIWRRNIVNRGYSAIALALAMEINEVLLIELQAEAKIYNELELDLPARGCRRLLEGALIAGRTRPLDALTTDEALGLRFDKIDRKSVSTITGLLKRMPRDDNRPRMTNLYVVELLLNGEEKCYNFSRRVADRKRALRHCMLSNLESATPLRLAESEAMVFKYSQIDGKPHDEIARRLGISVEAVAKLVKAGLLKLQASGCDLSNGDTA